MANFNSSWLAARALLSRIADLPGIKHVGKFNTWVAEKAIKDPYNARKIVAGYTDAQRAANPHTVEEAARIAGKQKALRAALGLAELGIVGTGGYYAVKPVLPSKTDKEVPVGKEEPKKLQEEKSGILSTLLDYAPYTIGGSSLGLLGLLSEKNKLRNSLILAALGATAGTGLKYGINSGKEK